MELDFAAVASFSLWSYLAVFVGGMITSVGPCNVAMIPLVIAFVSGQKEVSRGRSVAISFAFALGLAVTLALLGIVAALVGGIIGGSSHIWYYLVAAVCIVMGLQWAEIIDLPLPEWGARQREKISRGGLLGALLLGLASGLAASGCATPALAAILTLVMAEDALAYGASLLLIYGLGRGVPVVLFGSFAGLVRMIPKLSEWSARMGRASGFLMVGIGLYFLWLA